MKIRRSGIGVNSISLCRSLERIDQLNPELNKVICISRRQAGSLRSRYGRNQAIHEIDRTPSPLSIDHQPRILMRSGKIEGQNSAEKQVAFDLIDSTTQVALATSITKTFEAET
jgi:hypothetical protein